MRLGRADFWRFLIINLLAVAALAAMLPLAVPFAPSAWQGAMRDIQPYTFPIAVALCLPSAWMGVRRLQDTGRSGWQALLPLLPLAVIAFLPLAQQELQALLLAGRGAEITDFVAQYAKPALIGLWLGGLLLAGGVLRTFFLWAEAGDAGDNRYGPPPQREIVQAAPATPLLQGRMSRMVFWPIALGNIALFSALSYALAHWPGMNPAAITLLHQTSVLFYSPAFIAAALRLHDRDRSGGLALAVFVINAAAPVAEIFLGASALNMMNLAIDVATIYLLFQCWQPGDAGDNRYGPPSGGQGEPLLPQAVSRVAAIKPVTAASPVPRPASRSFGRRAG